MSFSATSASVEGFKLIGRKPGTFLAWCAIYFAVLIALMILLFATSRGAIMAMAQHGAGAGTPPDPAEVMKLMLPIMLVFYPPLILWSVLFYCAIYRSILRPEDKGFAYLKISGDEGRVFLMCLVMIVAWFAVSFGVSFGLAALASAIGPAGLAVRVIGSLVSLCFYLWLAVRVSLLLPYTFVQRRLDFMGAWRLTAGRFWSLLGMTLLVILMVFAILIAVYLVVGLMILGPAFSTIFMHQGAPGPAGGGMMIIGVLLALAFYFVLPAFAAVMLTAPFAAACRDLLPRKDAAEVFS